MELSTEMFMGSMFIVGLVLTIYAFKIAPATKNCSITAQNAVRGLIVMGVMLMSITGTFMICGCGVAKLKHETIGMGFTILMLLIGIIVMVLSSIIHEDCNAAKKDTPLLISLSVLVTIASGGYLVYKGYNMVKSKGFVGKNGGGIEMASRF